MYGSKKPDEEFGWTLTRIYNADMQEIDNEHTDDQLVTLLSIRNKYEPSIVRASKADEVAAFKESKMKKIEPAPTERKVSSLPSDLETISKLAMMLSKTRAEQYAEWLNVGLCLNNIDARCLDIWIEFSKQSNKFKDGECERLWRSFVAKDGGLTEGSLRFWAKSDNPEAYAAMMKESIDHLIFMSRSGNHSDVARVVHALFKDEFVCCFLNEKPVWYEFKGHRWMECPDAVTLRQHLSNSISKKYSTVSAFYHMKAACTESDTEQNHFSETGKALAKVAISLKNAPFKANIMKECKEMFVVSKDKFFDKLDQNKGLIGFNNGVFDLDAGTLRDGQPDDLVTYTVGYDYTEEVDEHYRATLDNLLKSIYASDDEVMYMLKTFAYALHGNKFMEFMQFWIGTGANGKGVLSKLLQSTFGQYCYCPDVSVFTTKKASSSSANPELAKMSGKRLAIATEPNEEDKFQVGPLKAWSGGDKIQARALYKDNIEFDGQFLMIIQMNHKPALSDFDEGITRRLRNVEFPHKFVSSPKQAHERQGDSGLKRRIETDTKFGQQFMTKLIQVYREHIMGGRAFDTPASVQAFTQEYLDANNKIGAFLAECVEITNNNDNVVKAQTLFDMFRDSDHYNGKDIKNFIEHMAHNGFKSIKHKKRDALRDKQVFYGLMIRPSGPSFIDDGYEC
jgi:P4 family phage/plasmid primase-like protien